MPCILVVPFRCSHTKHKAEFSWRGETAGLATCTDQAAVVRDQPCLFHPVQINPGGDGASLTDFTLEFASQGMPGRRGFSLTDGWAPCDVALTCRARHDLWGESAPNGLAVCNARVSPGYTRKGQRKGRRKGW